MSLPATSVRSRSKSRRAHRNQRRRLFFEGLESRRLLAADQLVSASPWQNHVQPLDANNDGAVTAIDFLVVVNAIGRQGDDRHGAGEAPDQNSAFDVAEETATYPDINGDQFVTALDALALAN